MNTRGRLFTLAAIVLLLGVTVGCVTFLLTPSKYDAEARFGFSQPTLTAAQVPAYVVAVQTLASEYSRFVEDNADARSRLSSRGGVVTAINASPIPSSSVIRIRVTATNPRLAASVANELGEKLIARVGTRAAVTNARKSFDQAYRSYLTAQKAAVSAGEELARLDRTNASESAIRSANSDADAASTLEATRNLEQQAYGQAYRDAYQSSKSGPSLQVLSRATLADADTLARIQQTLGSGTLGGLVAAGVVIYIGVRRGTRLRRDAAPAHDAEPGGEDRAGDREP